MQDSLMSGQLLQQPQITPKYQVLFTYLQAVSHDYFQSYLSIAELAKKDMLGF